MSERFWASGHWQVKEGKADEFINNGKSGSPEVVTMSRAFTTRYCFVR
jgi:hypothetical protein